MARRNNASHAARKRNSYMQPRDLAALLSLFLLSLPSTPWAAESAAFPVEETTIAQLHAAYLAGKTTARAVTQAYLDRIEAYDQRGPRLNSLINANARALDAADK